MTERQSMKVSELMEHCEKIEGKCTQCDKREYCEDFYLYTDLATPRVLKQIIEEDLELVEEKESDIHKWRCEQNEKK